MYILTKDCTRGKSSHIATRSAFGIIECDLIVSRHCIGVNICHNLSEKRILVFVAVYDICPVIV
jgi:hypothetical protein